MMGFRRFMSALLIVCTAGLGLPLPAQAGMLATDAALASGDRDRVAAMLDRTEVRSQLEALGVNPADVKARVDALSDAEVAQVAGRLEALPAGGEAIIGAIVFIFLILLITDILGLTKIFPFTRSVR
jgi:hypothetical protein